VSDAERLGSDRLWRRGEQLVVDTAAEMDGWEVRHYRKTRIHFDGVAYQILRQEATRQGGVRYHLEPWPQEPVDPPVREIDYDLEYVEARDAARKVLRRRSVSGEFLRPLFPLLGLLPSRWKAALQQRYGFHPRTMTAWSLRLEYVGILLDGAFLAMHAITGRFDAFYLVAVMVILVPDAWMRYDSLLAEDAYPPGFYEWLLRFRLR
jgi:hypothetical protein